MILNLVVRLQQNQEIWVLGSNNGRDEDCPSHDNPPVETIVTLNLAKAIKT